MALYPFQERVKSLLLAGESVILQAPTGSGKTRATLSPFIEAYFDLPEYSFPRQCIYSVPMRVLANQFFADYSELTERYHRRTGREMKATIQTGEQSQDPQLLGDLIFATIDQSLSSALAVPYSLSPGRANLNAGAFFSSYLVFDEFHLFPVEENRAEGALTTTLQLLTKLKGIVPFVLMTATFSSTMLTELAARLDAEVVTVPPDEYRMIASRGGKQPRCRRYQTHSEAITAQSVWSAHNKRSIAVCNQVARSQALYEELCALAKGTDTEIILLHSRFIPEDRKAKEDKISIEFGKEQEHWQSDSIILVATQVVEVGLDITCEHLHTEIAPANAVLQRAGRCARYPGEYGVVHIYPSPIRETWTGEMKPDYLPYPKPLCESTWQSFENRTGEIIDFQEEQKIIDEVHQENDRQLLASMDSQSSLLWDEIYGAMEEGGREYRASLIRRIDNITVMAASRPELIGNPFQAEGFGLWRGTVKGFLRKLEELSDEWLSDEFEDRWLMAYPIISEKDPDDPTRSVQIRWEEVVDTSQLDGSSMVVINSAFCAYDAEVGFRITSPDDGGWTSKPGETKMRNSQGGFSYELESYTDHIDNMLRIYHRDFRGRVAYVDDKLMEHWGTPPQGLDTAIKTAITLHDLGKLDKRWQQWVRLYQQNIGEAIDDPHYMAVHTNWQPAFSSHKTARKLADRQVKRPHHAGEGAIASARIISQLMGGNEDLIRPVLTAIARHHSPSTRDFTPYTLHPDAIAAVRQALALAELETTPLQLFMTDPAVRLEEYMIRPGDFQQLALYLLIVRYLRLVDGMSQER